MVLVKHSGIPLNTVSSSRPYPTTIIINISPKDAEEQLMDASSRLCCSQCEGKNPSLGFLKTGQQ